MKISILPLSAVTGSAVLALCLVGLRASAQLTGYSDLASWSAAISPATVSTITFEGIIGSPLDPNAGPGLPDSGNYTYFGSPPGLTVGYVNFQYTDPNPGVLFALGDGYYGNPTATLSPQNFSGTEGGITVTLPTPVTAFSTTIGSFYGTPFTFEINGNAYTTASGGTANPNFVGITSATPFTSFTVTDLTDPAMTFGAFNFSPAVPDGSSTAITLGMGLLGCGLFRRFRK